MLLTGPTTRQRPPRLRRPLVALAAALVLAAVAGAAAIVLIDRGGPAEEASPPASATGERLAPLPEAPPGPGMESMQSVIRVTLPEMIEQAEVVFVGAVEAVGGSESVPGLERELTTHRVRFRVEHPLRGIGEGLVDITEFDSVSLSSPYDYASGERFLVFAEHRRLGTAPTPVLVPVGYVQGIFPMIGEETARNEINGEITLGELERRLGGG